MHEVFLADVLWKFCLNLDFLFCFLKRSVLYLDKFYIWACQNLKNFFPLFRAPKLSLKCKPSKLLAWMSLSAAGHEIAFQIAQCFFFSSRFGSHFSFRKLLRKDMSKLHTSNFFCFFWSFFFHISFFFVLWKKQFFIWTNVLYFDAYHLKSIFLLFRAQKLSIKARQTNKQTFSLHSNNYFKMK